MGLLIEQSAQEAPKAISVYRCRVCDSVSIDKPASLGGDGDLCPGHGERELVTFIPAEVWEEGREEALRVIAEGSDSKEIKAGDKLYGFCGGAFGRDSYNTKTVIAVGETWVLAVGGMIGNSDYAELAQADEGEDIHAFLYPYKTEKPDDY